MGVQGRHMMRRMLVLGVVLSLCLPFAIAADDPGVNRTIDVEDTPIEQLLFPMSRPMESIL
ncbi:MAG: hypothetical protein Ct9H90mP16_06370 [Candidatus Poseidoniales archaeon]|nr:MAG: hypothetical protein Ct9H90mP16_06370 [Candidatus Poseidoniales archaeon]